MSLYQPVPQQEGHSIDTLCQIEQELTQQQAIIQLISTALGTGLFTLPLLCTRVGMIPLSMYLLVGGGFSYSSMEMIGKCYIHHGVHSFSEMAERSFGPRFKKFTEWTIMVFVFGLAICYNVFISDILSVFILNNLSMIGYTNLQKETLRRVLVCCLAIICIILSAYPRLKTSIAPVLRHFAPITFLLLFGSFFVTGYYGYQIPSEVAESSVLVPSILATQRNWSHISWTTYNSCSQHFNVFAMTMFCFLNHFALFSTLPKVKTPSPEHFTRIFKSLHFIELTLASLLAFGGYLLLQGHTKIELLIVDSINSYPFMLTKLFLCVCLFSNLIVCQESFQQNFSNSLNITEKEFVVKMGFVGLAAFVAFFCRNVIGVLGLLGGITGTLILGVIPVGSYIGLTNEWSQSLVAAYGVLTACGFCGAICSFI